MCDLSKKENDFLLKKRDKSFGCLVTFFVPCGLMTGYIKIEKYQELEANFAAYRQLAEAKIARLAFELDQLKRLIFGAKSERFINPNEIPAEQLNLFYTPEQIAEEATEKAKKTIEIDAHQRKVTPKKPARQILPEHLERREIIIEPADKTEGMIRIDAERSESLVYSPAEIYVEVIVRPIYVLPKNEQQIDQSPICIAAMPEQFIPQCMAHPTLLASIFTDKFVDHLPLNRIINRIERLCDFRLAKSTVSGWIGQSADRILPVYNKLGELVLSQNYLMVDETRMEVMPGGPPIEDDKKIRKTVKMRGKPKRRKTERGWMWVYHAPQTQLTFFDYEPSRGAANPARQLKNYVGVIQTDGLEVYDKVSAAFPNLEHFYCLVHGRRKFDQALGNDPERATYALTIFQDIYQKEKQFKQAQLSHEQIAQKREEHIRPQLEKLYDWLETESLKVLPGSPIGKAIGYMMKRKEGMFYFLQDGRYHPDTNAVERSIRPVAVGRKNYLFAGSQNAAQWMAMFYSFFACCQTYNVNPYEWLVDVMMRLPSQSIQNLEELLPHKWKKKE